MSSQLNIYIYIYIRKEKGKGIGIEGCYRYCSHHTSITNQQLVIATVFTVRSSNNST